jgi:hypothetical protein
MQLLNESTEVVFDPRTRETQLVNQRCEDVIVEGAVLGRALPDQG